MIPITVTPYALTGVVAEITDFSVSGLTSGSLTFASGDTSKTFTVRRAGERHRPRRRPAVGRVGIGRSHGPLYLRRLGRNGATAAVEVTVVPVNDAPVAVGVIPNQTLDEGGGEATVELTPFFEDIDGDPLAYRAAVSDPTVAAVAVTGAVLTLMPVEYGDTTVTVTVEDEGGLTATQTFAVGVSDRLVRVALWGTLSGMARSHLASARMTLGRRAAGDGKEPSRVTVLGRLRSGRVLTWFGSINHTAFGRRFLV